MRDRRTGKGRTLGVRVIVTPRRTALPEGLGVRDHGPGSRGRRRAILVPGALEEDGLDGRGGGGGPRGRHRRRALPGAAAVRRHVGAPPGAAGARARARRCSSTPTATSFTLTLAGPSAGARRRAPARVPRPRHAAAGRACAVTTTRGDIETDVTLSAWTEGEPHQVDIRRPVQGYEASFRLDKVERNVPVPERAFTAAHPRGLRRGRGAMNRAHPGDDRPADGLPRGPRRGAGAARRGHPGAEGRVRRDHRPLRLRQVHAAAPPGRPGPADLGPHRRGRGRGLRGRGLRAHGRAAPEDRVRLPALQPVPDPDRPRQPRDRAPDPGQRRAPARASWCACWRWSGWPTRWT